jgi:hypothetical protein
MIKFYRKILFSELFGDYKMCSAIIAILDTAHWMLDINILSLFIQYQESSIFFF